MSRKSGEISKGVYAGSVLRLQRAHAARGRADARCSIVADPADCRSDDRYAAGRARRPSELPLASLTLADWATVVERLGRTWRWMQQVIRHYAGVIAKAVLPSQLMNAASEFDHPGKWFGKLALGHAGKCAVAGRVRT